MAKRAASLRTGKGEHLDKVRRLDQDLAGLSREELIAQLKEQDRALKEKDEALEKSIRNEKRHLMLEGREAWNPSIFREPDQDMIHLDISGIKEEDRTPALLAAIDLVEHLLPNPYVSTPFCEQDDVGRAIGEAKTTVDDVVHHFRDQAPKILVGEAESYAWTGVGQHPSITLKREIVHATYRDSIEFSRLVFVLVVTLFHELSHWKVRFQGALDVSPNKFKWKRGDKAESGKVTEFRLFGGQMVPLAPNELFDGIAPRYPLRWQGKSDKVHFVDDSWLASLLRDALEGKFTWPSSEENPLAPKSFPPKEYRAATSKELAIRCGLDAQRRATSSEQHRR